MTRTKLTLILVSLMLAATWTALASLFRTPQDFLSGSVCLAWAVLLGTGLSIFAMRTPWWRAALWFTAGLVGQAVSLQLIWAGKEVRYQHWRFVLAPLEALDVWLLGVLGLQALAVTIATRSWWKPALSWFRSQFGLGRLLILLAVWFLLSVSGQKDFVAVLLEISASSAFMLVQLGTVLLCVVSLPDVWIKRLETRLPAVLGTDEQPLRGNRYTYATAIGLVAIAALLNLSVWERHPHITDEVAYYIQAEYMAQGQLDAPALPVPEAFELYLVPCDEEHCYSVFPPGWPAVLSLGLRGGLPWLVNPLLAGLNFVLFFLLIGAIYGGRMARVSAALFAASPWFIFMSMNYMSHTWALTCGLTAALCCAWVWRGSSPRWLLLGGVALGALSLTRPLDAAALAPILGIWMLFVRGRRPSLLEPALLAAATLLSASLVLPYNEALTGDPLAFPVMEYMNQVFGPGANALGFGPNRGGPTVWGAIDAWPGHSPVEALINTQLNANAVHIELFGWSIGSLTPLLLFLFAGMRSRVDWAMLTPIATLIGLYSLYYFAGGPDFGARYWYLAIVPIVALTGRALVWLGDAVPAPSRAAGLTKVLLCTGIVSAMALTTFMPWRAIDKYHRYWGMGPELRDRLLEGEFKGGLVLVRGAQQGDYSSARIYNPRNLDSDGTIFAWNSGPAVRQRLLEAYPDRTVWFVDGPTLTGGGYVIVETLERR